MLKLHIQGLVAATFTPMSRDGSLRLDQVPAAVSHLESQGVSALFVCGSTGEGFSLASDERRAVTEAYLSAAGERFPVIVQVGHDSLEEARRLAEHAASTSAVAIAAAPPTWFKPTSIAALADFLAAIGEAAPETPLFYYHIPPLSGVHLPMRELLALAPERVPTLAGIKFSHLAWDDLAACIAMDGGRFNILYGADESLLSGLVAGADGAVGSTYNFLGRLSGKILESAQSGRLEEARQLQATSARLIHVILRHGGMAALKATLQLAGVDCGPPRLPLKGLGAEQIRALERDLREEGFFEWA